MDSVWGLAKEKPAIVFPRGWQASTQLPVQALIIAAVAQAVKFRMCLLHDLFVAWLANE
jgi:hypothetical protein